MKDAVVAQMGERDWSQHWWFAHRRRLIKTILDDVILPNSPTRILDLGCGVGVELALCAEWATSVHGLELSMTSLTHARQRLPTAHLVCGDINQVGSLYRPESFHLVFVLGVLHHQWIPSPLAVMRQIHDLLTPGGVVVLTDTAFPILARRHDRQVMGARRFRLPAYQTMLREAGLIPLRGSYWNTLALPAALLLALWERWRPADDGEVGELALPPPWLNHLLLNALAPERWLLKHGARLPAGVSLLAMARRPER